MTNIINNSTLVSYLQKYDLLTVQFPTINKLHIKNNIVDKQVKIPSLLYINAIHTGSYDRNTEVLRTSIKEITFEDRNILYIDLNKNTLYSNICDDYCLEFLASGYIFESIIKFDLCIYYNRLRDIINIFPNVTEFNYYHPNEYQDKGYLGYMYCLSRQYPGINFICVE